MGETRTFLLSEAHESGCQESLLLAWHCPSTSKMQVSALLLVNLCEVAVGLCFCFCFLKKGKSFKA